MKFLLTIGFLLLLASALAQDIRVHDPVMIREGDRFYLFCTGRGISVFSSPDMKNWAPEKPVFETPPAWALQTVAGFTGHIWAPDIAFYNGMYYLYYSVSAFGKNTSCIGVATNRTLDPIDKAYAWVDHGKVIQSVPGRDLWNAIDPNLAWDGNGRPWLVFGSFWSGIKLTRLSDDLTQLSQPEEWHTVARRPRDYNQPDEAAGPAAVEAPFIFRHGEYYYLFVSFDSCCRGKESTYKIVAGRAHDIQGPYVDAQGIRMDEGGGKLVAQGNTRWAGVGHNAVCAVDGTDYLVCHGYDRRNDGMPTLIIRAIHWNDAGWPEIFLEE